MLSFFVVASLFTHIPCGIMHAVITKLFTNSWIDNKFQGVNNSKLSEYHGINMFLQ